MYVFIADLFLGFFTGRPAKQFNSSVGFEVIGGSHPARCRSEVFLFCFLRSPTTDSLCNPELYRAVLHIDIWYIYIIFFLYIYIYIYVKYIYIDLSVPSLHILVGPGDLGFLPQIQSNQSVSKAGVRMETPGSLSRGAVWTHGVGSVGQLGSSLLGIRGSFLEVFFLLRAFRHCSDIVSLDSIDMAKTIKQKHDLRSALVLNNLDMFLLIVVSWALQDNLILHYLTTFLVDSPFQDYCTSRIDRHTRSRATPTVDGLRLAISQPFQLMQDCVSNSFWFV